VFKFWQIALDDLVNGGFDSLLRLLLFSMTISLFRLADKSAISQELC